MGVADDRIEPAADENAAEVELERRLAAHAPALRAAAAGLCRGTGAPELDDLVQDTFERALRHLTTGRPAPDNERAWLVSILRHVFIDRLRAVRPRHETIDELPVPAPEPTPEPIWAKVSIADVEAALARIDPGLRAPFELHYLQRMPYAEVAAALEIPPNTVASRLHRARKAVRDSLLAAARTSEDP
jgi:RNA polymerase sigma-70 factor (ECF subfamily)